MNKEEIGGGLIFIIIIIWLWFQVNTLNATIKDCNNKIIAADQTIANAGGDISDAKQASFSGNYTQMKSALDNLNASLPQQSLCGQSN
jgi:hypothetical protein